MFDEILNHKELSAICRQSCHENQCEVLFDEKLFLNGDLDNSKIIILKPDEFYNSINMHNPPPSPDCLILVKCKTKEIYHLYLIELKDVKNTKNITYKEISAKFQTMIEDFFTIKFKTIFDKLEFKKIEFYVLTTYPKGAATLSENEYNKKIKGTVLDLYTSQKPFKLYNKIVSLTPRASLTILAC